MNILDELLKWVESFLSKRKQGVKIRSITSEWLEIWGTVQQGSLFGVLKQTAVQYIKYVDDTTIYHATNKRNDTSLQEAVIDAIK